MMIRFKHVYVIQRKEDKGLITYVATFPALSNVGGISDTPEGAIEALRSALIGVLQDIEAEGETESELPDSLEDREIIGFGVLEATSDDPLPFEEDDED
jgi:predicted RNase H-like HicB family nuclease